MANAFNLTAVLNFAGPANLKPVIQRANRQLKQGLNASIDLKFNNNTNRQLDTLNKRLQAVDKTLVSIRANAAAAASSLNTLAKSSNTAAAGQKNVAAASKQATNNIQQTGKAAQEATTFMFELGKAGGLALKRFAGFTIATGLVFGFVRAIEQAVNESIKFERELVKIAQVRQTTIPVLKSLTDEITRLAKEFGVSANSLVSVSRILTQTGLTARETKVALEALAKSELAPTFGKIEQTAEGAIAAMRQFRLGADDLESALGSVNAVAGKFAVESEDIIAAVRRAGGVFAAASGDVETFNRSLRLEKLQEFVALFTSVRATTRESAETIATGLRTVFTRIQRGSTIVALRELGVNLQNAEGNFVGAFEAVRRLNEGLSDLDPRSSEFNQIIEELGGFRQVGKVIPLIQRFSDATDALGVAQRGQTSLSEDAVKAQQTLAVQIAKVREEFSALIRDLTNTSSFRTIVTLILQTTSGLIKLANAVKPIIPLLTAFAAIKGISAITQFGRGFIGGLRGSGGVGPAAATSGAAAAGQVASGQVTRQTQQAMTVALRANTAAIQALTQAVRTSSAARGRGFNNGGVVPGTGNSDTVRAMLTPGEFVLRKSVTQAIGQENLQRLNRGGLAGFQGGGTLAQRGINLTTRGKAPGNVGRRKQFLQQRVQILRQQQEAGELSAEDARILSSLQARLTSTQQSRTRRFANRFNFNSGGPVQRFQSGGVARIVGFPFGALVNDGVGEIGINKEIKGGISKVIRKVPAKENKKRLEAIPNLKTIKATADIVEVDNQRIKGLSGGVVDDAIPNFVNEAIQSLPNPPSSSNVIKDIRASLKEQRNALRGTLFEAIVRSYTQTFGDERSVFDFPGGLNDDRMKNIVGEKASALRGKPIDAKINADANQIPSLIGKAISAGAQLVPEGSAGSAVAKTVKKAMGGVAGEGEVNALLTPGEFVFRKEAVDRIGLDKLQKLNDSQKFHSGGPVGSVPRFGSGGPVRFQDGGAVTVGAAPPGLVDDVRKKLVQVIRARIREFEKEVAFARSQGATTREAAVIASKKLNTTRLQLTQSLQKIDASAKRSSSLFAGFNRGLRSAGSNFANRFGGAATGLAFTAPAIINQLQGQPGQVQSTGVAAAGGAVTGALAGGFAGAAFGPAGIAIGAGLGAVAGGLTALNDAIEANNMIELNKATKELEASFRQFELNSDGGQSVRDSSQRVIDRARDTLDDRRQEFTSSSIFQAIGNPIALEIGRGLDLFNLNEANDEELRITRNLEKFQQASRLSGFGGAIAGGFGFGDNLDERAQAQNLIDTEKFLQEIEPAIRARQGELVSRVGTGETSLDKGLAEIDRFFDTEAFQGLNQEAVAAARELSFVAIRAAAAKQNIARTAKEFDNIAQRVNAASQAVEVFSNTLELQAAQLGNVLDPINTGFGGSIGSTVAQNPFAAPLTKTAAQVETDFNNFSNTLGIAGTQLEKDLRAGIVGSRQISDTLNDVLLDAASGGDLNAAQITTAFGQDNRIASLPDSIRKSVIDNIEGFLETRQSGPNGTFSRERIQRIINNEDIGEILGGLSSKIAEAGQQFVGVFDTLNKSYEASFNQLLNSVDKVNVTFDAIAQRRNENANTLSQARGNRLSIGQRALPEETAIRTNAVRGGVNTTNVAALQAALQAAQARQESLLARRQAIIGGAGQGGDTVGALEQLGKDQLQVAIQLRSLERALSGLANSTQRLAGIQEKLASIEQRRDAARNLGERLATAGPEEILQINQEIANALRVLSGEQLFGKELAEALNILKQIQPILTPAQQDALNKRQGDIIANGLNRQLAGGDNADKINVGGGLTLGQLLRTGRGESPAEQQLIVELERVLKEQTDAQTALAIAQRDQLPKAFQVVTNQFQTAVQDFQKSATEIANSLKQLAQDRQQAAQDRIDGGAATGGFIPGRFGGADKKLYRVTPGEFVVNRGAAMKHSAALKAINSGAATGMQFGGMVGRFAGGAALDSLGLTQDDLNRIISSVLSNISAFGSRVGGGIQSGVGALAQAGGNIINERRTQLSNFVTASNQGPQNGRQTIQTQRANRRRSSDLRQIGLAARFRGVTVPPELQNPDGVDSNDKIRAYLSAVNKLPSNSTTNVLKSALRRALSNEGGGSSETRALGLRPGGGSSQDQLRNAARVRQAFNDIARLNPDLSPSKIDLFNNGGVLGFRRGGSVPGIGNRDVVPAILTPGEFVVNKKATANNLAALQALNRGGTKPARLQNGSAENLPRSAGSAIGIPTEIRLDMSSQSALTSFNTAVSQFSSTTVPSLDRFTTAITQLGNITQQLANIVIPDTIEVSVAPIQVNVNVNGAEQLANLEDTFQDMIQSQVRDALQRNINPITGETQENFLL